jgi:hypothetical protein
MLGVSAPGWSQNPLCPQGSNGSFCVTTPLAASGNGSCFVNMCFTYSTNPRAVQVTSYQPVSGTNCSSIVTDLFGLTNEQALLEAIEKEAIRITVERCEKCIPPGTRVYTTNSPACWQQSSSTHTRTACTTPPNLRCVGSYFVTCDPSNPYSWIWGQPGGSIEPEGYFCGGEACSLVCPW